ncbi:sugar ABC transporter ATP-binding protein [Ruthenibacterium lactatiformans]|uniref:sugar ABC transporter ATP-binding protein n=1 Tax=Ruthenibacterium lactatiformans TaxID=1550024 RepID=UPI00196853E7|nr:sugar ABC transporter ATP-binding protein [Ruthenibacterium lactatiformans]MBN3016749.1 sugar ABC transporter ATP-binding protein [Ruthenibacterium lactatiformans]
MQDYSIALQGIYKKFGAHTVLEDVDFKVRKGSIHALVGGNGAGKSTLMKIISGVYTKTAGEIFVDGKPAQIADPNDAYRHGVRMIYQEMSLVPTLTVLENIFLNREEKKGMVLDRAGMEKRAREILAMIGFEIDLYSLIQDCSVGICQMVEIAKALSEEGRVLIMDEPTTSLTDDETRVLFEIIRRLRAGGVSVVYISHRLKEVLEIAEWITVLRDGRVVKDAAREEYDMNVLISIIVGSGEVDQFAYVPRKVPVGEEVMLKIRNLSWAGNKNHIDLDVYKGEVVGIVGLLGSGRTEMMEVLCGLRRQNAAELVLDGKPIQIRGVDQASKFGISMVPEDRRRQGLVLIHTVKENLCLPNLGRLLKWRILSPQKCNALAEDCVRDFNIVTDSINQGIQNLSGGNQQKVVISKWFKTNPKVLLMDEPTAGVDIGAKGEIINLVRTLAESGRSILFISSELPEVLAVCDRIVIMEDGGIKAQYDRGEITGEEMLQYEIQH